ncbi:adhesion G-protein coupled receptor G6-like [Strongylocentrotus purpuratus]|uniref:Uncharacterized protein n=1 Tax=Strongylocentrotus purpuratus TaxID=7668 RepID=A0A7M7NHE6_STRPU|nr:adhesion G-protein coupled receptor G6-like [Strongylocentrotus purpuratus]
MSIDGCAPQNPCLNGGICSTLDVFGSYSCNCPPGWTGTNCNQLVPCHDCELPRNITQILESISERNLTNDVALDVSENIARLVTENISAADVILVSNISSRIADLNYTDTDILDYVATIASNIADVGMEKLREAEEEEDAVSQFVLSFERQLSNVQLDDGESISITRPNVAVQIRSVAPDDFSQGLVIARDLPTSSTQELTASHFSLHNATDFNRRDQRNNTAAQVSIPKEIFSTPSSSSQTSTTEFDMPNNESHYQKLVFNVYSSPSLHISRSLRNISESHEGFNRSANTLVLSLKIGRRKVEMVDELINFTFTPLEPGRNPVCTFWDEDLTDWSSDGCRLLSHSLPSRYNADESSNATGYGRVVCGCNHLTSFAVLMDIYHEEHALEHVYRNLSYIGCGISIVSLIITVGAYLSNRVLRKQQRFKILILLCLTLLLLYISFVIMLVLDSTLDNREVAPIPCAILTAVIHYSLLSSMAWMGVEGFNAYLHIIKIFDTYIPRFMQKATLAACGIPALIVTVTGAVARKKYAHHDRCFLKFWSQIGGLLIPIGIMLLVNIVIFSMVIVRLVRSANPEGLVREDKRDERRETINRVQIAISNLVILGLTWTAGFLLFIDKISQVAEGLFIALNALQGFFIFLLYFVRMPFFRKQLCKTCRSGKHGREVASSQLHISETASSSSSSTTKSTTELTSKPTSGPTSRGNVDAVDGGEGGRSRKDTSGNGAALPPAFIEMNNVGI